MITIVKSELEIIDEIITECKKISERSLKIATFMTIINFVLAIINCVCCGLVSVDIGNSDTSRAILGGIALGTTVIMNTIKFSERAITQKQTFLKINDLERSIRTIKNDLLVQGDVQPTGAGNLKLILSKVEAIQNDLALIQINSTLGLKVGGVVQKNTQQQSQFTA